MKSEARIVLFCGSRHWNDPRPIRRELRRLLRKAGDTRSLLIIEGGAPGADLLSKWEATKLGIHVAEVNALWDFYHKAAGPIRNEAMLALRPHEVIAFHVDLRQSKGTKDCVKQAESLGIPRKVVAK